MSGTTRRILTAKGIALVALGLVLLVVGVIHRRSLSPTPPGDAIPRG